MAKKTGGQPGNNNAGKGTEWGDALNWALKNYKSSRVARAQALRAIAMMTVEDALNEDDAQVRQHARTEIANRKDGKATENRHVTGSVTHEHGGLSDTLGVLEDFVRGNAEDNVKKPVSH